MTVAPSLDARVESLCGDLSSIRAPRGTELNARSWATEAPLRMLLNNLDAEVAEKPGGARRLRRLGEGGALARGAASDRRARCSSSATTRRCSCSRASRSPSSGRRPVAPRVLIANSLLVPEWATWDEFRRLEAEGLTMFGQMTAGSWIYIGTQGILQGTYQTFAAAGEKHFGAPSLAGRTILTAGLGGMGGAQPLAGDARRRGDPLRRGRPGADRAAARDALPRRGDGVARRRARARSRGGCDRAARCRSGCSATPPTSSPSSRGAASTSTSSPTRPRRTIR